MDVLLFISYELQFFLIVMNFDSPKSQYIDVINVDSTRKAWRKTLRKQYWKEVELKVIYDL